MMQWTPLAQAKNVGAHFDLTLAKDRWVGDNGGKKNNWLDHGWCGDGAANFNALHHVL